MFTQRRKGAKKLSAPQAYHFQRDAWKRLRDARGLRPINNPFAPLRLCVKFLYSASPRLRANPFHPSGRTQGPASYALPGWAKEN